MRIRYSDHFIRKCNIPHYPISGFIAKLSTYDPLKDTDPFILLTDKLGDPYLCNTFLESDHFVIQFDTSRQDTGKSTLNKLLLFYVDHITMPRYTIDDFKVNELGEAGQIYENQLAATIIWDNDVDNTKSLFRFYEIFRLPYVGTKPKCSFTKLSGRSRIEVSHYNSDDMGQSPIELTTNNQLISTSSGLKKVREKLSTLNNQEVNGVSIIRPNGLIQL